MALMSQQAPRLTEVENHLPFMDTMEVLRSSAFLGQNRHALRK